MRPYARNYAIQPLVYFILSQILAISTSSFMLASALADDTSIEGCSLTRDIFDNTILAGLKGMSTLGITLNSALIFKRMLNSNQLTNFVVAHIIWVELTSLSCNASFMIYTYAGLCSSMIYNRVVWVNLGTTIFIARTVDSDFREALIELVGYSKGNSMSIKAEINYSAITEPSLLEDDRDRYLSVFRSLHLKFILDALVSLSYTYKVKLHDPDKAAARTSVSASVYSINAKDVMQAIPNATFNEFFNDMTAYKYRVVEYYPEVFKKLREDLGINPDALTHALNPLKNFVSLEKLLGMKGGSSGAIVYTTHDSRFVIKSITTQEKLVLLNRLLEGYIERISSNDSALVRIIGVYQIQCINNYSTNLMVMENVSLSRSRTSKFDLKGSIYKRASESPQAIGKDCDFLTRVGVLDLEEKDRAKLLSRLSKDCSLLLRHSLMDYSLLVTVCEGEVPGTLSSNYLYMSKKKGEFYIIALIDFFQEYNFNKKLETLLKNKIKKIPLPDLSSVEPSAYHERFTKFVARIV
eukprot:CAMPEP_0204916506 /NCGR_PEP_ID=MMETSP1397-20131031/14295_1 /ASSEMBLY_ACC=CAM_ASM_000891 /TAXON_ID=49980 /ORGANISM="Climacostomum Climacostomum virens, Strain Stock W-24" /LENGTH=523 /DNA_ID=CAMNT_0052089019 /DNA_START=265 /DNA_END=1836 /DNA_ORIENTATION=-